MSYGSGLGSFRAGKSARRWPIENRNTILIDLQVEPADGFAERRAAIAMVGGNLAGSRRITLAADRGHDTRDFVDSFHALTVTPQVAQNQARRGCSALNARTVRPPGFFPAQVCRSNKPIELSVMLAHNAFGDASQRMWGITSLANSSRLRLFLSAAIPGNSISTMCVMRVPFL
jgi:hypothetical protein